MRALLLPVVSKSAFDSGISLSLVDAAAGLVEVGAKDLLGERDECVSTGDADRLKLARLEHLRAGQGPTQCAYRLRVRDASSRHNPSSRWPISVGVGWPSLSSLIIHRNLPAALSLPAVGPGARAAADPSYCHTRRAEVIEFAHRRARTRCRSPGARGQMSHWSPSGIGPAPGQRYASLISPWSGTACRQSSSFPGPPARRRAAVRCLRESLAVALALELGAGVGEPVECAVAEDRLARGGLPRRRGSTRMRSRAAVAPDASSS